jgi:hypothetical protein
MKNGKYLNLCYFRCCPTRSGHALGIGANERFSMASSINSKMDAIGKICPIDISEIESSSE